MYLVAGATGSLGGGIATRLLERGDPVRVIVRAESPARAAGRHTGSEALAALGAEFVEADLTDHESLKGICDGVSGVVFTASGTKRMPPDTLDAVDVGGSTHLSRLAADSGVDQFVYVSTLGASPDHPSPVFSAKGRAEQGIRASGVGYTMLHPVKFMQDWIGFLLGSQLAQSGSIQLVGPGDVAAGFVDESDVADAAVAVLGRDDMIGATVPLSTEAATYSQLVERISRVIGKPITWTSIAPGETVDTVDPELAGTVTALLGMVAMSASDDRTFPEVAGQLGLNPTGIDDFLRTTFG